MALNNVYFLNMVNIVFQCSISYQYMELLWFFSLMLYSLMLHHFNMVSKGLYVAINVISIGTTNQCVLLVYIIVFFLRAKLE